VSGELWKNSWADFDLVWVSELGGFKDVVYGWGCWSAHGK